MSDDLKRVVAEFLGTAILIILGNGVVANVVLNKTKGQNSGWIVIAFGWGMAVFVAVMCVGDISGAHINPAVTIAMLAAGKFQGKGGAPMAMEYIAAQMIGGIVGATIVYFFYRDHFNATPDGSAKLACFSTGPAIRNMVNSFFCEVVGTFLLVLPIFLMGSGSFIDAGGHRVPMGLGAIGQLPVGLLVLSIGLSLGGTTGYAINPARDLGPRIAHAILPIRAKGDSDWSYAWIPVVAPIVGGLLAAAAAQPFLH
jgi:glycerol uptake facilitator protein